MDLDAPDDEEEERMRKITSQIVAGWATASLVCAWRATGVPLPARLAPHDLLAFCAEPCVWPVGRQCL